MIPGIVVSGTIFFYVILLHMPTFARTQLHLPLDQAFSVQAVSLACMIVLIPIFGALSDHIGRKPIMIGALILYFVFCFDLSAVFLDVCLSVLYKSVDYPSRCCLMGAFSGPTSTALAEQFPAHVRSTGLGTAYNMAVIYSAVSRRSS